MKFWCVETFLGALGVCLAAIVGGMLTYLPVDTGRRVKRFGEL